MSPAAGVTVAVGALAFFLLGWALGERRALTQLLEILEREGVERRDLPLELIRRVRHRPKTSTGA